MRKEVIYAILAGISIGLVAAFGTWRVSKIVKVTPAPVIKKETPKPQPFFDLSVTNLKNFDVISEDPTITGKGTPNTEIIISTLEKDYITKTNTDGLFSIQISLPSGISEVKLSDTATLSTQKITLIYSNDVENGSVSYVGTITDISSGTIQIKNHLSSIVQTSVTGETKFINTLKKNVEIKETDLAIGDYIIAIGTLGSNKVLQAKKVLIAAPTVANNFQFEKIKIDKLSKTKINDITLPKTWVGPNINDLAVEQIIYTVGTISDDKTYTLRTILTTVD